VFLLFLTSSCGGFLIFGEWKINTRQFEIPTSQISLRLAEIVFLVCFGFVEYRSGSLLGFWIGFLRF
jgi:hypothetical protein